VEGGCSRSKYFERFSSHMDFSTTTTTIITTIIVIIIIILIRHELSLNSPVSASSHSLFKGLPSHLRPFDLQFSSIFGIMFLLSLATSRSQPHLHLLRFSSVGSIFNSFKILHSFCGQKGCTRLFF
jgi:hypothetical protein